MLGRCFINCSKMRLIYISLLAVTLIIVACNKEQAINETGNPQNVELYQKNVDSSEAMLGLTIWDVFTAENDFVIGSVSYDVKTKTYLANTNYEQVDIYLEMKYGTNDIMINGLQIIEGHLYLYFSIGSVAFAEDVNIQNPQGSFAGLQSGSGETHTCDGTCGGSNSLIAKCTSCDFDRVKGKIVGCKCLHSPGICCHTKTITSESGPIGGQ